MRQDAVLDSWGFGSSLSSQLPASPAADYNPLQLPTGLSTPPMVASQQLSHSFPMPSRPKLFLHAQDLLHCSSSPM